MDVKKITHNVIKHLDMGVLEEGKHPDCTEVEGG